MTKVSIIICYETPEGLSRACDTVKVAVPTARIVAASNLTDAYNLAEHDPPQFLLICSELASRPDFELLFSLMKILKIGCWLFSEGPRAPSNAIVQGLPVLPADSSPSVIQRALQPTAPARPASVPQPSPARHFAKQSLIVIGASTGGVDALAKVLAHLSKQTPPTMIVQHTGGQFSQSLIRHLDSVTEAIVRPAIDGQRLETGHVYLSPSDAVHLCLDMQDSNRIQLRSEGPLSGHRPSIDALFRSARPAAHHTAAALLTGMGRDGARGLKLLRDAGATTIGQDATTSVVYGMPRVAHEMGAVSHQLPIQKIGPALLAACSVRARA